MSVVNVVNLNTKRESGAHCQLWVQLVEMSFQCQMLKGGSKTTLATLESDSAVSSVIDEAFLGTMTAGDAQQSWVCSGVGIDTTPFKPDTGAEVSAITYRCLD